VGLGLPDILAEGAAMGVPDASISFLAIGFEGDRHQKRIDKIAEIEKKYSK